jgi:tetratricopeptide (TPR) repeat protein
VAGGSFKYCGDFSVSFAIHLPQTAALSFQNQFRPALKVGLIRNDKSMLVLQGDIALAAGLNDKAIELLRQSDKENGTALSMEALAHAYQQAGQIDQAVTTFQKMLSSTGGSLSWEPQQRWLAARYTLASDYSSRGDKQKARDTLATLLTLWKNADPDLPTLVHRPDSSL